MSESRALSGVKVVELSTFVAASAATRFFADQGADVIKVEPLGGDPLRWVGCSDGIPDDLYENVTYEVENGNKRSLSLNLNDPTCYEALMKLIENSDIFVTNWRPQALFKMKLDYESLKIKFPKLVYGSVTGYGEVGPDKDLPGYDATAFFTRSGILGSTYEKGTVPMNLIPSMGDRQTGMALAAGILAALFNAQRTGKGEKVMISLLNMAIFTQATFIQASQYGKINYPITKDEILNPLTSCYKTKDGRFIQLSLPVYNMLMPRFAKEFGHEEWIGDPDFGTLQDLQKGHTKELYDAVSDIFAQLTTDEAIAKLKNADLPHSLAKVWSEVLEDEQAWACGCFTKMQYESGERIVVNNPVQFSDAGPAPCRHFPQLGENTVEILKELGYEDEVINQLLQNKNIRISETK